MRPAVFRIRGPQNLKNYRGGDERVLASARTSEEAFAVDTADHEDHTFCGIMFSIVFKDEIPLESMEVEALSVRGHLGPITVWVTRGHWDDQVPRGNGSSGVERKYCNRRHWQQRLSDL